MLEAAGLTFSAVAPGVDETVLKRELAAARPPAGASEVAAALARAKALAVSARLPSALVLGADQVLAQDSELFDKPGDATLPACSYSVCAAGSTSCTPPPLWPRAALSYGAAPRSPR